MAELTISEELLEYFTKLPEQDQRKVISIVKNYVENEDERPQTIEEYNLELEEGSAAIDRGEYVTHEAVVKYFENQRKSFKPNK